MLRSSAVIVSAVIVSAFGAGTASAVTTVTGSTLTVRAAHSIVAAEAKDSIVASLSSHGQALANQRVLLESRSAGAKHFTVIGNGVTSSNGQVSFTVVPGMTTGHKEQYVLRFRGNKAHRGSFSGVVTVTVR